MTTALPQLADAGVAVWLDDLSRPLIVSGRLRQLISEGVVGVTTNPAIFAKSIGAETGYEDQVRDLALRGTAIGESLRLLTASDVRAACDLFTETYERSGGRDGRVSIEVDPRLAGDTERTTAEARGLWWLVDRPNLFIKIPATKAGLPAITACLAEGISINVTLIFSLKRYESVLDAFMSGLEQRAAKGESLAGLESVASFFVSRVDSEVDRRLAVIAGGARSSGADADRLHGQAALANARLAYEIYQRVEASPRWQVLASKGARLQRLLWASTGVKDKAFPATRYVLELVARDTVNTMPKATLEAVATYDGLIADDTVVANLEDAHRTADDLRSLGIDVEDVAEVLEREGVEAFAHSWSALISSVESRVAEAGAKVSTDGAVKPASGMGGASSPPAAAPSNEGRAA